LTLPLGQCLFDVALKLRGHGRVVGLSRGMVACQEMASCRHKPVVKLSLLNMRRLQPHTHGKHCFVVVELEGASLIMTLPYAIYMTYCVV